MYHPLLLFGKKHYTGLKYEAADRPGKRDIKGLACVRKDICPFLRDRCREVIDLLLSFRDLDALAHAQAGAERLLAGLVPLRELVLSKKLNADYKLQSHAQLQVAKLMEARNPGAKPRPGDRVSFVFVESGDKHAAGYERAEDPAWVEAHPAVRVDLLVYFEKQLRSQVGDLFSHVHAGDPFDTPAIAALKAGLVAARGVRENDFRLAKSRQHKIDGWVTKSARHV